MKHLNKTHVDLCSGIGGFALGLDEGAKLSKPIYFVTPNNGVTKY